MEELLLNLLDLVTALGNVVVSLFRVLIPWLAFAAWIVFWLFAVDWNKLHPLIWLKGGIIAVLLIAGVWIMVWGMVAPPAEPYKILDLKVSNFVGKTVFVTLLLSTMFLCGSAQLAGCCRTPEQSSS